MCVWVCVCVCVCVCVYFVHRNKSDFPFFYKRRILRDLIFVVGNKNLRRSWKQKPENLQRFLPAKLNYDNYSFKEDYFILEVLHAFYSKCQSFNSNKVYRLSLMELNTYYNNFKRNSRALWVIGTFSHVFLRNYIPS